MFIFCGKDSDEVRYFISEIKSIHNDKSDPVTFLSIADRLASDGKDLNAEFKQADFTSRGIIYHHADVITEAGEKIKHEVEVLKSKYPIEQYNYKAYDYWPGKGYGKAFNTTRKLCRLLGCTPISLAPTKSMDENGTVHVGEHISVSIARDKDNLPSKYEWLVNKEDPTLPSAGIRITDLSEPNEDTPSLKEILFFFKKPVEHVEDMAEHVCKKVLKYKTVSQNIKKRLLPITRGHLEIIPLNLSSDESKRVKLWTEFFGERSNQPLLLIMGSSAPGILWADDFCEELARNGLFVIRYDHRDTGRSERIDYDKNPYTILDLAEDAIAVLDGYRLKQAHIVGLSMGGQIAQFLGADYSKRVLSLTIISSSSNFEPFFNACQGVIWEGPLSGPTKEYIFWLKTWLQRLNTEGKKPDLLRKYFMERWQQLDSNKIAFDSHYFEKILSLVPSPAEDDINRNHSKAMLNSISEHRRILTKISAPTLIIHGTDDVIFPVDHGEMLAQTIQNSTLKIIDRMGHQINTQFFNEVIGLILDHSNRFAEDITYRQELRYRLDCQ